jgi:hypothetical protein
MLEVHLQCLQLEIEIQEIIDMSLPTPFIGGLQFYRLDGSVQMAGQQIKPFTREGIDGVGFIYSGFRANEPFSLTGRQCFSSAYSRDGFKLNANALRGTLVSVVDETGSTWNALMVMDVKVSKEWKTYTKSASFYFVELQFTLMPTATSY